MTFVRQFNPANGAVELYCTDLAASVERVTFYWTFPGSGVFNIVRGGQAVPVQGGGTTLIAHHDWPPGQDGAPSLLYGAWMLPAGAWDGGSMFPVSPSVADQAWFKWLGFPFLNRRVKVTDYTDPGRDSRTSLLEVIRGTAPVAVQELMGSRRFEVTVQTNTWAEWRDLDQALAVGGVMMLHADEEALGLPSVYFTVDRVSTRRERRHGSPRRWTTVALVEVAAPSPLYAGAIATWSNVVATYASWQALLDAQPTWRDVATIPATSDDVIVGDA